MTKPKRIIPTGVPYYTLQGRRGNYTIEYGVGDDIQYRGTLLSLPRGTTRDEARAIEKAVNRVRDKWRDLGIREGMRLASHYLEHMQDKMPPHSY